MTKVKAEDNAVAVQELLEGVGQLFYIETAEQLEAIGGQDPGHLFVCYVRIPLLGDYYLQGNSKRHDLQSLQDSIYRHGFKISLLYDPLLPNVSGGLGAVQCGNGRVEDLLYIYANRVNLDVPRGIVVKGEEWYAPVSFGVNDQTREDAIAFSIGENVSNVLGADGFTALDLTRLFDEDQLKAQLGELMNFDAAFPVGLEVEDLSVWLGLEEPSPEPQPEDDELVDKLLDDAEDGKIESRVKLGEIWACGRHRVACGSSTDKENILKLTAGRPIFFVWSDPPYGISIVNKEGRVGSSQAVNEKRRASGKGIAPPKNVAVYQPVIGDDTTDTAFASISLCEELAPKSKRIYWGANHFGSLPNASCWIVWDKKNDGTDFADCELAWTNFKGAVRIFRHMWNGMLRDSENNGQKRCHPNQKPIVLAEWIFEKYGTVEDFIFDPFLGSGISILAAQRMQGDRTVFGFELSEAYCEVILRRYEQLTGEVAQLVGHL
jgi:site-specific DNA-methyltransferase (adenine-specific)